MQKRATERRIPNGSKYFQAGGRWFRHPRSSWRGRLALLIQQSAVSIAKEDLARLQASVAGTAQEGDAPLDTDVVFRLAASESAVAAVIGVCWADLWWDLETGRPQEMSGAADLLSFGDRVLDELNDYDDEFTDEWVASVGQTLYGKVLGLEMPTEDEIAAQVGNGLSPEVTAV